MYKDYQCCKVMNLCRNKQIKYDILTFSHCFFGNTNSGTPFADNIANVSGKRKPERENKAAQPQTKNRLLTNKYIQLWEKLLVLTLAPQTLV